MKKKLIAGTLVAAFLIVGGVGSTPGEAGEPVAKGLLVTPAGVPLKSYPVTIEGTTASGQKYNSYVLTDDKGKYQINQLPPGHYTAIPAGQTGSAVPLNLPSQKPTTVDLGTLSLAPGPRVR